MEKFILEKLVFELDLSEDEIVQAESFDDLGLDSLAFLEVISDIEDEYDIEFEDTQLANIKSYSDLIETVNGLINEKNE